MASDGIFNRFNRGRRAEPGSGSSRSRAQPSTDGNALQRRDAGSGSGSRVTEAEILAAIDRVPSLPAVVNQILSLVGRDGTNAQDLENLVEQDMVIAGRLLKIVNSQFYGLPNAISSLQQAVAIVGMNSLRSLVLAASAAGILQVPMTAYGYSAGGLWKNSVVTASLAKEIAKRTGRDGEEADEFFIAALLRDVGMLVLGPFLERQDRALRRDQCDSDIIVAERQIMGFDHCWVGERIAEKWRLPPRLAFVITKHHRIPKDATGDDLAILAGVRLAERLTAKAGVGLLDDHPFETAIDGVLLGAVGLDAEGLKGVIGSVPEMMAEAETFQA